jgi:Fic family protein
MAELLTILADSMANNQNKLAVLEFLKNQQVAITLSTILRELGESYSERTVRRWLSEWVIMGLVKKTGQKRGAHYAAVKEPSTEPESAYFSPASQTALAQVRAPYALRKPLTYNPAWLNGYRPNIDTYLEPTHLKQLYEAGNRAKDHKPAGTYARHIYNRLLIDLSYNSSRLEGNTYSLLETKQLLIEGLDAPGKLNEEKTMILNHKEAIRYLVDQSNVSDIQETTIYTLHYLLSDGLVSPQYAGKVRDYGVRIGGSSYIPLENPERLRTHLKEICNKANLINNPYEKSIFLLAHIAYLQAFVDVNKRTARLSANSPLIINNLVPLSFDGIKQDDYTAAMLAVYELNDTRPLVDLYMYSYLRTAEKYDVTVEAIGFDPIRVEYRQLRREIIRHIISAPLHGHQIETFIHSKVLAAVKPNDQAHVSTNIKEDLEQLGPQNIAGLGITAEALQKWLKNKD